MRVLGIGGFFFRAENPEALMAWYEAHLLPGVASYGWEQEAGQTIFAPFPADTDYFPADRAFMLNLRVEGLEALIARLRGAGIAVETRAEWDGAQGRFARLHDPEGNPVELWEPPA